MDSLERGVKAMAIAVEISATLAKVLTDDEKSQVAQHASTIYDLLDFNEVAWDAFGTTMEREIDFNSEADAALLEDAIDAAEAVNFFCK